MAPVAPPVLADEAATEGANLERGAERLQRRAVGARAGGSGAAARPLAGWAGADAGRACSRLGRGDGRLSGELRAGELVLADVSDVGFERATRHQPEARAVALTPDAPLPLEDGARRPPRARTRTVPHTPSRPVTAPTSERTHSAASARRRGSRLGSAPDVRLLENSLSHRGSRWASPGVLPLKMRTLETKNRYSSGVMKRSGG